MCWASPAFSAGALDTRAEDINEAMKLAAAEALAEIACEEVPADVMAYLVKAYPEDAAAGMFDGERPVKPTYVIPKPFDPRVVPRVARKVAAAAMGTGLARRTIEDLDAYEKQVRDRVAASQDPA